MRWNTDRRTDVVRLRGRANQERRLRVFARNPLCVACQAQGRVTLATIADHALALAEGGADDETNLVGLCDACHRAKTQRESQRGQARAR
jgi:5-methylcytosine-specific restriction protein A